MQKKRCGSEVVKQAILQAVFSVAFILSVMLVTHNAYSAQNQVYAGDGAVINRTVPPGGWLYGQGGLSCLVCHNPSAGAIFRGPDKTSYLKTGHKNILRRAQDAPVALTGPDGNAYTADGSGNVFNWTNNTINILGSCSNSSTNNQGACTAGGGVWISGSEYLYYILGGWMVEPAVPMALYDGSYTQGTQKTAVLYSCARCHTTGYTMDAPVQTSNRNPEASFQGISWTPSRTTGTVDFDPDGDGPAIAGSWVMDGIQCERCHDATDHGKTGKGTLVSGVNATALCMQCHRQEHTLPYAGGGLGSNIVPTPYTDNGPLSLTEPLYPLPAIEVGGYSGYAKQFYGYSTGMEFLNGAHGKYTGNFQQIGDTSYYGSTFINEDPSGGGCTTCHDVHQSTVTSVNASAPFKKTCSDCHVSQTANLLNSIKHPTTRGTPFGDDEDILGACIICHMPRPNNGVGASAHIFRINVTENYSTFPTQTEWNAGYKTANTSADGTYANAVWNDLDMSCGQCHGGSDGQYATKNGAPYMSKWYLSVVARNMHVPVNLPPTASFTSNISNYTVTLTDTSTDDVPFPPNAVTVNWGDGSNLSIGNAGGSFSHTYATAGTFNIMYTVRDAGGLYDSKAASVVVPTKYSITVNISPLITTSNYATFVLKLNGSTKAYCNTSACTAPYVFSNWIPNTYTVTVTKSGYTFDCDPVTIGNQSTVPVTIGPNATITCTHTP
jgi:predicted CXXCH cytochrome family protein